MASGIKNGNKESPIDLGPEYLKIVVIGEPNCGKTSFIRACLQHSVPQDRTSINGVRVYPCEFEIGGNLQPVALYEIPGHPDSPLEVRIPHYMTAKIFVYMYAIDDPTSLEMLCSRWIPETSLIVDLSYAAAALVGTKKDLRDNQQVIERLALNNQVPVTPEQTVEFFGPSSQRKLTTELSSNDSDVVLQTFRAICNLYFSGLYL